MSDESKKTPSRRGATRTASLRPEGKRQVAGVSGGAPSTAKVPARTARKSPDVVKTRRNPFAAIVDYVKGVFREMSKVIWPTGREMVTYTIVVLVFLALMTALVAGVDYVANLALKFIFDV